MEQLARGRGRWPAARDFLGAPDSSYASVSFVLVAAGAAAAAIGEEAWIVAGLAWVAAAVWWKKRPRREDLVRQRLRAAAKPVSCTHGAHHFEVGWVRDGRQGHCVLGSLQEAGVAAARLARENEAESEIYCFESIVWPDVGNLPKAQHKWDRAAARWEKITTVEEAAALAAVENMEHDKRLAAFAMMMNS